jgi:Zn-dependent protease with chaperone function
VSYVLVGGLGLLAGFGVGSLGGSALVLAAWRFFSGRIGRMPAAVRARLVLGMRLFPTAAGLASSLGLVLPAYILFEPHQRDEIPGAGLWILALIGFTVACQGIGRLFSTVLATERIVRRWSRDAEPISLDGVDWPVYRIETETPIVALAGAVRPRLFIASSVLEGCGPDLVAAMAAHEVGHWHSGDNVKRLMLEGAADPLPLFASGRRMMEEWESASEESADDEAISHGARPEDLAESLVRVARLASRHAIPEAAVAAAFYRGEAFERRVRRLLGAPARTGSGFGRTGALLSGLVAAAWLAAAPAVIEPMHRLFESLVHSL